MSLGEILAHLMDSDDEKDIRVLLGQVKINRDGTLHYNLFRSLHNPY